MRTILLLLMLCGGALSTFAQFSIPQAIGATGLQKEASDGIKSISDKSISFLQKKYERLDSSIEKQSHKMLCRLQRKEEKLQKKLVRKDSLKAAQLFDGLDDKYAALENNLSTPYDSVKQFPLREYIPSIDSMQTALSFLKDPGLGLPQDKLQAITKAANELKSAQDKLQKANDVESFAKERERYLKDKLQDLGLAKELKSINKETFYFQSRLKEYKELLNNKEKAEQKLLGIVRNSHLFQDFMKRNSYAASLFPSMAENNMPQSLAGLQTVAGVQQQMQQRFGMGGFSGASASGSPNGGNPIQQQMQAAQSQLSQVRNRLNQSGVSGGNSDMTMPDFKPNNQHTKTFLQRLEYGANMQSEQSRSILPATSELAVTAGYKLNDKSSIGLGASYRIGWGSIQHIKLSSEGLGLRSYLDIKAKGSFWLTGGYEMDYMQRFSKYQELYDLSLWQRSGLIGLKKKYKIGKKENNIQLLWDFLSYQQTPRSQPLKFRIGFNL